MLEANGGSRMFLSMMGQHTVPPDPAKVQQLVEMGFLKENSEYHFLPIEKCVDAL